MITRPLKDSDVPILRAMYDASELQDGWPDLETAKHVAVLEDDTGKVVGMAGVRLVPELFVLLAKAHPAARMGWLRMFHVEQLAWMHDTGHTRAIALIAPKIARGFLRRLASLGWREGAQSAIFLVDGEPSDEGHRSAERPIR